MVIYLVVEIDRNQPPRIIGAFKSKRRAHEVAYDPRELTWRNVIPLRVM